MVVLRQTLSFASGKLTYADDQEPLCEVDEFFGAMNQSSVRQESDFCQYKPHCDVIVNATAYAPKDRLTQFDVHLRVFTVGEHDLPEAPRGLNYRMEAPPEEIEKWRKEVKRIQALPASDNAPPIEPETPEEMGFLSNSVPSADGPLGGLAGTGKVLAMGAVAAKAGAALAPCASFIPGQKG